MKWAEIPEPPRRTRGRWAVLVPVLMIALPLAVATLLWTLGHHHASVVVLSVGAAIFVVERIPALAGPFHRGTRAVQHGVVQGLTFLISVVFYFLVITPLGIAKRVMSSSSLERHADPQLATYWQVVPPRRNLSKYTFTLEPSSTAKSSRSIVGIALQIVGFAALLIVLNGLLGYWLLPAPGTEEDPVARAKFLGSPAMQTPDAKTWASAYFDELEQRLMPTFEVESFTVWHQGEFHGTYINNESGNPTRRRTYTASAIQAEHAVKVYIFGGSAAWGYGQRDEHTIASEIARLAEADGIPIVVSNYANIGYVSWQEFHQLMKLVVTGNQPDLAVFYDGYNDQDVQLGQDDPNLVGVPQDNYVLQHRNFKTDLWSTYKRFSWYHHLLKTEPPEDTGLPLSALALPVERYEDAVTKVYQEAVLGVRGLASAHGFEAAFFWQPTVFTRRPPHPSEVELKILLPDDGGETEVYRRVTKRVSELGLATDLTHVMDSSNDGLYVDVVHTGEQGAHIAAEAVYRQLKPRLLALAAAKSAHPAAP